MGIKETDFIQLKKIIVSHTERQIKQWFENGEEQLKQIESFIIRISQTCTRQKKDWYNRFEVSEEFMLFR
jgi:hypothetical protein